ncbi:MAG: metallophosphoesterase family protein [Planctomycetaceae bacterium]
MRILVLADIHANWPALQAIREPFDACLFAGDLVDYGVDPAPCLDWIQQHARAAVRGNHDHNVAHRVAPRKGAGFRQLMAATRPIQWSQLNTRQLGYLARLPIQTTIELDGFRFTLVHATPRDPFDEYLREDPQTWQLRCAHLSTDFLCVGHSHFPFHLRLPGVQVVNPGSVGQPRDGDPRASYAIIENGQVQLRRVEYDIDQAVSQLRGAGLPADTLRMAEHVLRTGGRLPEQPSAKTASAAPSG